MHTLFVLFNLVMAIDWHILQESCRTLTSFDLLLPAHTHRCKQTHRFTHTEISVNIYSTYHYIKSRVCPLMLLICVIMDCSALMEEESVPFRKSGLLKCHSRFRGLSFKRKDFSPLSSLCLFSPFSIGSLFCSPVFIVHPLSLSPSWRFEKCHNVLFDSGTSNRDRTALWQIKVQYPSLMCYSVFIETVVKCDYY